MFEPPLSLVAFGKIYRLLSNDETIKEGDVFIHKDSTGRVRRARSGVGLTPVQSTKHIRLYYYTPEAPIFNEPILTPEVLSGLT